MEINKYIYIHRLRINEKGREETVKPFLLRLMDLTKDGEVCPNYEDRG